MPLRSVAGVIQPSRMPRSMTDSTGARSGTISRDGAPAVGDDYGFASRRKAHILAELVLEDFETDLGHGR